MKHKILVWSILFVFLSTSIYWFSVRPVMARKNCFKKGFKENYDSRYEYFNQRGYDQYYQLCLQKAGV